MFGKNPLRKADRGDGKSLLVHSIFYTIQGEGPFSGRPAIFIRLAGCNLACTFCDTEFENDAMSLLVEDVMETVTHKNPSGGVCSLVVITGGEPLRQEIGKLCHALVFEGYDVQIETAGTLWPSSLDESPVADMIAARKITFVCSPKTGVVNKNVEEHCRDWKYIIQAGGCDDGPGGDGLPMFSTQKGNRPMTVFRPSRHEDQIWLQPMDEYKHYEHPSINPGRPCMVQDEEKTASNMRYAAELAMRFGYRITLQTHKILELP